MLVFDILDITIRIIIKTDRFNKVKDSVSKYIVVEYKYHSWSCLVIKDDNIKTVINEHNKIINLEGVTNIRVKTSIIFIIN